MIPVIDGKMPLAVNASRAPAIHDAIAWAEKQNVKIVIMQPRDITKAGAELKAKNVPVVLGRVLALPENEDAEYDEGYTQPLEAYKAGVKFALGHLSPMNSSAICPIRQPRPSRTGSRMMKP